MRQIGYIRVVAVALIAMTFVWACAASRTSPLRQSVSPEASLFSALIAMEDRHIACDQSFARRLRNELGIRDPRTTLGPDVDYSGCMRHPPQYDRCAVRHAAVINASSFYREYVANNDATTTYDVVREWAASCHRVQEFSRLPQLSGDALVRQCQESNSFLLMPQAFNYLSGRQVGYGTGATLPGDARFHCGIGLNNISYRGSECVRFARRPDVVPPSQREAETLVCRVLETGGSAANQ